MSSEVTRRAIALYKNTDPTGGLTVFDTNEPMEAGRKTKFSEAADKYYEKRTADLHEQADRQQQERDGLQRRRTELDDDIPRLEGAGGRRREDRQDRPGRRDHRSSRRCARAIPSWAQPCSMRARWRRGSDRPGPHPGCRAA